jgi:hypothetical protein
MALIMIITCFLTSAGNVKQALLYFSQRIKWIQDGATKIFELN